MRVLHTSDWHLGKTLRGRSRTDEFEKVLLEILDIAIRERADVVLVTGDIFDSVAPSAEAERLFYQGFLAPGRGKEDGRAPDPASVGKDETLLGDEKAL